MLEYYCNLCELIFECKEGETVTEHGGYHKILKAAVPMYAKTVCPGKIKPLQWRKPPGSSKWVPEM